MIETLKDSVLVMRKHPFRLVASILFTAFSISLAASFQYPNDTFEVSSVLLALVVSIAVAAGIWEHPLQEFERYPNGYRR